MHFQVLALLEVEKCFQRQINLKNYTLLLVWIFFQIIWTKTNKHKISIFIYTIYAVQQQRLKVLEGLD